MRTKTINRDKGGAVRDSYLELVRELRLRPLRNNDDYAAAVAMAEKLAVRWEDALDEGERDYLDALDQFIAEYDRKHHRLGAADKRTPLQRLRYLLEESQTTQAGLQKILGVTQPMASMIMSGDRELSTQNIRKLSDHFKVDVGYFF